MMIISEEEVKKAITIKEAIEVLIEAYRSYSNGKIKVPDRISMAVREGGDDAIILAANYLDIPYYGLKEASSFPSNMGKNFDTVISNIQLYSADSGEFLALVSATHLTAVKTGSASAVATKYLSRPDSAVLGIIGTGVQARTQLAAIQEVRQLDEVRVFDLQPERQAGFLAFAGTIKNRNFKLKATASAEECIRGSDIIVTATTSSKPVIKGEWLSEGTHINAVGSFTPEMQEIDSETVVRASKIVCDKSEELWAVAGDLLVPLGGKLITKEKLHGEVGDVITGTIKGRENDQEITIYESIGFAALDIAVAVTVYESAMDKGLGVVISF